MTAARAILQHFKKSAEKSLALTYRCFSCHNSLRMLEWEEIFSSQSCVGAYMSLWAVVLGGILKSGVVCCCHKDLLLDWKIKLLWNKQCATPSPIFPTTQGCWLGRADWCGGATSETLVGPQGCSANRSSFYIQCLKGIIKTFKVSLLSINFMYKNCLSFFIVFQMSSSLTLSSYILRFSSTLFFLVYFRNNPC